MNLAASHLVNRSELQQILQNARFFIHKNGLDKKVSKRKERIVSGFGICLWGKGGRGLIRQRASLVWIGKFQTGWFKITFLGGTGIAGKSWFAVLKTSDSPSGLLFLFLTVG